LGEPPITDMNTQLLIDTAKKLVADDKGLLAMDESNPTCNKRFAKLGNAFTTRPTAMRYC
jgi:fructose-bisphosphate aldolase class I